MIRNAMFVCIVALGLGTVGCKGGDDAKADQLISIMEDIGKAVKSAGDDCGKMAEAVGPVVDKHAEEMKELKAWAESQKGDAEKSKKMMEKYGDRMMKAAGDMMDMAKCSGDAKFEAINKKMKDLM